MNNKDVPPIRRVNFFAGPGCGKTGTAAGVFSALKERHYDVEHIPEYVKTWAHEGRKPVSYDQLYLFAKQVKAEDVILRNVSFIVNESPLLMNCAYSQTYNCPATPQIIEIARQFDRDFPPLNFLIERTVKYNPKGRYQNEEEAKEFDRFLAAFLDQHLEGELIKVTVQEFDNIMSKIEESVGGQDS